MSALLHLLDRGGWVMPAILTLSVLLYWRCFRLLLSLWLLRRRLHANASRATLHRQQAEVWESFRRQRAAIGPMIAAAPLLGLLGTVSGMEKSFGNLSSSAATRSMEDLAGGISEVLVATQSGLMVAIPAMLLLYAAHREVHRQTQVANRYERGLLRAGGNV
jgi:biopolymer transport protein ExbB